MLQSKLTRLPQRLPMPAPQSGQVLAQHFPFPTGAKVKDYSSYDNNGVIIGAKYTNGNIGQSLFFDGVNDYVDCGNDSSLKSSLITISGWFKLSSLGVSRIIVGRHWDAIHAQGTCRVSSSNYLGISFTINGAYSTTYATTDAIKANIWTHFAFTYDGTNVKVYKNGTLIKTENRPGTMNTTNQITRIGAGPTDFEGWFIGNIDGIKIFNRALSAYEIKLLAIRNEYICRGA